jgi:hypothetical protein
LGLPLADTLTVPQLFGPFEGSLDCIVDDSTESRFFKNL